MEIAIEVKDLHKTYQQLYAVQGVSFQVQKGEIFGILGPNGAGKTTTLEMIEGLRSRDKGEISVLGLDPEKDKYELRERIGIQFQATSIQDRIKVKEALDLFSSFYKTRSKSNKVIEMLGLGDRLNEQFQHLSGGWKQRLTLALATIHDPEIVFLDEPSTGLDPKARREMWNLIRTMREEGKTIVLTTHYMEEAEQLCDRIAMFHLGKVVAIDQPQKLVRQLVSVHYLSFNSSDIGIDDLLAIEGVEKVEQDQGAFKVYTGDLQETSYYLFQTAKEKRWTIENYRFETGSLDDLFVQLAGEERSACML